MHNEVASDLVPHKEVEDYLNAYLAAKIDQGSAVLIAGGWGSGKTEFIKRFFQRPAWKKSSQPAPLTASFFGAKDEAAISDQFLSQLYPALNSTYGKVLGTAAFRLGNTLISAQTGASALEQSDISAVREWAAHPKKRIVVFDDLERATFGVDRALSLINGYVETDGLRVIVIANESEIACDTYSKWKEKVVGKTLNVRAEPESVIEAVAHALPHGAVKGYLTRNPSRVAEVLEANGSINYRSFRMLMGDAHRLVDRVDQRLAESAHGLESVILFSIAIGSEFRAGRLAAEEIAGLKGTSRRHIKAREEWNARDVYLDGLEARVRAIGAFESVVPPRLLAPLWSSGALQVAAINEAIAIDPAVVGQAAAPAWRRMWELFGMSRAEYENAKVELEGQISDAQILKFGELLHVVGVSLLLERWGVYLMEGKATLEWLSEYISREDVGSKLIGAEARYGASEGYGNLGFHERDAEDFKVAMGMVVAAAAHAAIANAKVMLPEYMKQIGAGDYSSIYAFRLGNLVPKPVPWLQHLDPEWLVSKVVNDGAIVRDLVAAIFSRYDSDLDGWLKDEWPWLVSFRRELRGAVRSLPSPQRQICTAILRGNLERCRGRVVACYRRTLG
ncbi:P-loop NTPase fold protein [Stenotrophomonas sp. CFBP8994]|uniref:P-loop NTPase fold protein n=1 Tax=Stenotrophomonas sp. CFBP8994 TaxID=3096527 RepID=UPI002A6AB0EF|nr:P-loop NTPase fold protein [Stenotrophomonas sp. CFBP8994]MDY0981319.1 P-loop NTPase fold protein [Stenotrophomonas sp. CFBP8994]